MVCYGRCGSHARPLQTVSRCLYFWTPILHRIVVVGGGFFIGVFGFVYFHFVCMYVCMFLWLVGIDARLAVCALLFFRVPSLFVCDGCMCG